MPILSVAMVSVMVVKLKHIVQKIVLLAVNDQKVFVMKVLIGMALIAMIVATVQI